MTHNNFHFWKKKFLRIEKLLTTFSIFEKKKFKNKWLNQTLLKLHWFFFTQK